MSSIKSQDGNQVGAGLDPNSALQAISDATDAAIHIPSLGETGNGGADINKPAAQWYYDAQKQQLIEVIRFKVTPYSNPPKPYWGKITVKYPSNVQLPPNQFNAGGFPENKAKAQIINPPPGYTGPSTTPTFNVPDPSLGQVSDPSYFYDNGKTAFTDNASSGTYAGFLAAATGPGDTYQNWYNYQSGNLNGDFDINLATTATSPFLEVGSGGTVTISGGTSTSVWVWHQKNIVWRTAGINNTLVFDAQSGSNIGTTGILQLNLRTGVGVNPWGGTINVSGVNNVAVGTIGGEYIIANDGGDTINRGGSGAIEFGGNALIVGGAGNDTIAGTNNGTLNSTKTSVIIGGAGTNTLSGGGSFFSSAIVSNIFVYGFGTDTITNFRASANSGDVIDLSAVPGVASMSDLSLTQSGSNTVIDFGGGHRITLNNVTSTNLTPSNFIFSPKAAFILVPPGEVDTGHMVQLTLAMTGVVSVSGGPPTLTLSNGAIATYDPTASSAAGHVLVFDYTPVAGDHAPNLSVTAFNPNGATISDANGHAVDFSAILNQPTGVQINTPLKVSSITTPQTGEVDAGQTISFVVTMTESGLTVDTSNGPLQLTLSNGANALLASQSGNQFTFNYVVSASDHINNLSVTGIIQKISGGTPHQPAVTDAQGFSADFTGVAGFATGLQLGPKLYAQSYLSDQTLARPGTTAHLYLQMNEAVTVTGSPTLSLSDSATATYDSAQSSLSTGLVAFDYNVGANDLSSDLRINAVSGGSIQDGSSNTANFAGLSSLSAGLQVGTPAATITSFSASSTGVGSNQVVLVTIQLSGPVSATGVPHLIMNAGATDPFLGAGVAYFDTPDSNLSAGKVVFRYSPDPTDNAGNLAVSSIDLTYGSIVDANGIAVDLSSIINQPTGIMVGPSPLTINSITTDFASYEAQPGQTMHIKLTLSEAATVDTSAGSPTLTLNDGATATYDAGASNLTGGVIVFDYVVGATDSADFVGVSSINLNGSAIKDSGGHALNPALLNDPTVYAQLNGVPTAIQIGAVAVGSVSTSGLGNATAGQTVRIGLNLTAGATVDTTSGSPTLSLNSGGTATYDAALSDPVTDTMIFDYVVGPTDHASNLRITGFNPNGALIEDFQGVNVNFSGALGVPTHASVRAPVPEAITHDLDGSGTSDIIFRRTSDGLAYLFSMNDATVTTGATLSTQVGSNWKILGVGDFNGDTGSDILWGYNNPSNSADPLNGISYITIQSGRKAITGSNVVQQLGPEWSVQGVGDFDGDGKADVLYRRSTDGALYLDAMNGASVDFSKSGFLSQQISDLHWQIAGIADFDGDGHADILWRYDNPSNPSDGLNGVVYEWMMNGTNVTGQGLISSQPGSDKWQVAGTGDFDGNGTADILFRYENAANAGDALNGFTYLDLMNGTNVSPSSAPTQWQVDNSWSVASIGDYNGDGKSDILFQHAGDGGTYIWDMNGVATTSGNFTSMQSGPGWAVQNGALIG